MSLWTKIRDAVSPIVRGVAAVYTGGASEAVIGAAEAARSARRQRTSFGATTRGGDIFAGMPMATTRMLPALPGIGRGVVAGGRALIAGGRSVVRSANSYCKRNPAWCASVGGLAAVADLVTSGRLPPVKRSRSRGISGTELKHFRRVSKVLDRWCKTPPPRKPRARSC